jgi:SAM-dependent methyltransferase
VIERIGSYQESPAFTDSLEDQLVQAGVGTGPGAAAKREHHVQGVDRTLQLLPHVEPFFDRPVDSLRVLDVGCATGSASIAFAWRQYGQVHGIDINVGPLGVSLAKLRAKAQGLEVRFCQGDACALPYAGDTFDLCFCDWVIEHVPAPLELLQEMRRVLAPGGLLYVSTNNRLWPREAHVGLWGVSWLPHKWAGRMASWLGRWPDPESWDVWLINYWQFRALIGKAGLQMVGTRKDIVPPSHGLRSCLLDLARSWRLPVDALAPNLYALARKPR